ncbi:hypothetical protein [Desulfosporosinus sp. SB140]|uniref:hypothetical protein n=1 Tax=Desulfosporosinus paludis TaxID=3115649 RepID=UPI00388FE99D
MNMNPCTRTSLLKDELFSVKEAENPPFGYKNHCLTVHLVVLKTSGELCYTLVSGTSAPQTTLIAKLDVGATKYRRLFLFPQGKMIHIFYALTHPVVPNLWHIEHRLWNGVSWQSTRMGEVVHPREPLNNVNFDRQGNLHFLTISRLTNLLRSWKPYFAHAEGVSISKLQRNFFLFYAVIPFRSSIGPLMISQIGAECPVLWDAGRDWFLTLQRNVYPFISARKYVRCISTLPVTPPFIALQNQPSIEYTCDLLLVANYYTSYPQRRLG